MVCNDAAKVPAFQAGYLNEAHHTIAQHVEIVQLLTARLMEATKHGGRIQEVQQLEAAIASLTSHQ